MIIKLCLNGEIHRISNIPDSFENLMTYAIKVFKDKMPEVFTFQYPDSDNDMVMLVNEESYKTMLETEQASSIKIFIVQPGETMSQSSMFRSAMIRSRIPGMEPVNNPEPGVKLENNNQILNNERPEPSEQNHNQDKAQIQDPRIEDSKNERDDKEPEGGYYIPEDGDVNDLLNSAVKPSEEDLKNQSASKIGRFYKKRKTEIAMEKSRKKEEAMRKLQNINRSVTKIQKVFRGYATRRELKRFAESLLQETSHNNPKRKDLIDHPERIMQHRSDVLYPEKPIIESLERKRSHPPMHTDIEVIKGALREVFLENVETLTKLLKPESKVEVREQVQEVVDMELVSIVRDIVKTYTGLNPFLKDKIDDQFKGSINKLCKHYNAKYDNPQPSANQIKEAPKKNDMIEEKKDDKKIEVTSKYDFQYVKEVTTVPKIITSKDNTIYKTIVIKNPGPNDWPKNTIIACLEGFKASECKLTSVQVGKEYSAVLALSNPGTSGTHKSLWRACYTDEKGQKVFFGSAFNVELVVDGGSENKTYSEAVLKKVKELKEVLSGVEDKVLCEYVAKNSTLSVSDLLDRYFSNN